MSAAVAPAPASVAVATPRRRVPMRRTLTMLNDTQRERLVEKIQNKEDITMTGVAEIKWNGWLQFRPILRCDAPPPLRCRQWRRLSSLSTHTQEHGHDLNPCYRRRRTDKLWVKKWVSVVNATMDGIRVPLLKIYEDPSDASGEGESTPADLSHRASAAYTGAFRPPPLAKPAIWPAPGRFRPSPCA